MTARAPSAWARARNVALLLGALAASCGGVNKEELKVNRWGRPIPKDGGKSPSWVDTAPESGKARIYAVGYCGPTYWPQDALTNAAEDARGKLALSLASHVEVLGKSHETDQAGSLQQLDLTKEATDLVMQNSRIEATWVDESGLKSDPGSVWALAAIDVGQGKPPPRDPGLSPQGKNNQMPGWLDKLPSSASRIYAAGYSGPTYRPDDALQYAGDQAVENLASSLRSHVQAYQLLIETSTGLSLDDFSRSENPDEQFLALVRKNARVEQVWVDEDGNRPGDPPGAVWALAGIDVRSTKGGYDTVQNSDTGPALDRQGNAGAEPPKPVPRAEPAAPAEPGAVPAAAKPVP